MTSIDLADVKQQIDGKVVLFFDGVCNFCNGSVNFIIDRDPDSRVMFAPLQSEVAKALLAEHNFQSELDTMVVLDGGKLYTRSSAVIRASLKMRGLWPLLSIVWIIPKPLRDLGYRLIAYNRYRWFGKQDSCRMPTPDLRARFLATS
jgi:predicted DCC family thiol-disulfide oxidoreductase YuxK